MRSIAGMGLRLLTVLWASVFICSCAGLPTQIETPQLSLAGVSLQTATLMEQRYRVTVKVENPNPLAVPIKGLNYAIRLAGTDFASGTTPNPFSVPANGASLVDIDVSTNLLQTARQLMTFLSGNPKSVDYEFSGDVQVDLPFIKPIPFSKTGQVAVTSLGD